MIFCLSPLKALKFWNGLNYNSPGKHKCFNWGSRQKRSISRKILPKQDAYLSVEIT